MKTTIATIAGAGALIVALGTSAFAQDNTDLSTGPGVPPSASTMPDRSAHGVKNVNPKTGRTMSVHKNPSHRLHAQRPL